MRSLAAIAALAMALELGCGSDSSASISPDAFPVEELEVGSADAASFEVNAETLVVQAREGDVAPGTLAARFAKIFGSASSARAVLGGATPSVDFSKEWLVAYRPDAKSPTSRVVVTRAQLSASGKTLSLWATVSEPAEGCAPWLPNEVALSSVPAKDVAPTAMRVFLSKVTASCGLTLGPGCTSSAACPSTTPICLGGYEQGDGAMAGGRCAKAPPNPVAGACGGDEVCGVGAFCAGLSMAGQGACVASWMRGTFSVVDTGRLSVTLPQGGAWHRAHVIVTGQASVAMDAWVQLFVDGAPPSRIEWKLSKGYGSPPQLMRVGQFGVRVPVPVPGDEPVNADWLLEVRDLGVGAPAAIFRGARLSVTSRFD